MVETMTSGKEIKFSGGPNQWIPACVEAIDFPDASGLVYKKGWKPRYFVAKNGVLYYFEVKDDKPVGSPMGSLVLSKCSALYTNGGWTKGYSFRLSEHPARAYLVALLTEPDMKFWINFISSATDSYTKRTVAATRIQSLFRGKRVRRKWITLVNAAVTLQSHYRLWTARAHYVLTMKRIAVAQRTAKAWIARSHFKYAVKRKRIVAELLATERSYVANLKLSIEIFIHPLLALAKKEQWAKRAIEEIFSNWENIYTVQCSLLKGLEDSAQIWTMSQMIADIFLQEIESFKVYASYVNNFDKSVAEVARLSKTNEAFKAVLLAAQSDTRSKAMDLQDFLILPIQRLPRYSMLLKDLIKNTPRSHPDYAKLVEAESKVRGATVFINEQKRDADNLAEVQEIRNLITGKLSKQLNFGQQPKLLYKGEARTPVFGGDYAYLFSEVLLITKPKRTAKYHLEDIIPIQNAIVTFGATPDPSSPSFLSLSPAPSPNPSPSVPRHKSPSPSLSRYNSQDERENAKGNPGLVISKSENHVPLTTSSNSPLSRKKSLTDLSYHLSPSPSAIFAYPPQHDNRPPLFPTTNSTNLHSTNTYNNTNYRVSPTYPSNSRTPSPTLRSTGSSRNANPTTTTPSSASSSSSFNPSPTTSRVGLKAAPPARPHATFTTSPTPSSSSKHSKSSSSFISSSASASPILSPASSSSSATNSPSLLTPSISPPVTRPPRSPSFRVREERKEVMEEVTPNWVKVICPQKEILLVLNTAEDVENWKRHIQSAIAVMEERKRALITSKVTHMHL